MNHVYQDLAKLLEYPAQPTIPIAEVLAARLEEKSPQASELLLLFTKTAPQTQSLCEELYTSTFEVNPACSLYAGHILLGESYKRGELLVMLKAALHKAGLLSGIDKNELPDFIPLLLKLIAGSHLKDEQSQELVHQLLLPALNRIWSKDADSIANPYVLVLKAVTLILDQDFPKACKEIVP